MVRRFHRKYSKIKAEKFLVYNELNHTVDRSSFLVKHRRDSLRKNKALIIVFFFFEKKRERERDEGDQLFLRLDHRFRISVDDKCETSILNNDFP